MDSVVLAYEGKESMMGRRNAVVVLGTPGSGKTSLCREIGHRLEFEMLDTARLLRVEKQPSTRWERKIRRMLDSGGLPPHDLVWAGRPGEIPEIKHEMLLFDGFPSKREEIKLLFQIGQRVGFDLFAVLVLDIARAVALDRLTGRRICIECNAIYNVITRSSRVPGMCDKCPGRLEQEEKDKFGPVNLRLSGYARTTKRVIEFFEREHGDLVHRESGDIPLEQLSNLVLSHLGQR
jgi:adenylate kinase